MKDRKKEVIKHSAAVHVQNNITLLQRRAWNVLLANAYDVLPSEDEYRIRVHDLMQVLEFDSKNEDYLKEALRALVSCKVEWNVLGKDGEEEWGVTTLLAQAKITRGLCTYAYSPELRRRLHNPRMYARISLSMQNKFESKHAQALWELCVDYLGAGREYGETSFIPLDAYRKLMGVEEDAYPEFKKLNTWVIKTAVDEINRVTDFRVTVDYQRAGRRVTAVKFKIRRVLMLPEQNSRQGTLFPDLIDMPVAVKELKEAGLSAKDAWEIWQQGFDYVEEGVRPGDLGEDTEAVFAQYIREKIHLLKRRQASGKMRSGTGFLLQAIKHNYANPEFAEEQRRQEAAALQKARQSREREIKALQEQKAQLEKACWADKRQRCKELAETAPDLFAQAVDALSTETPAFKKRYRPDRTPVENYHDTALLWVDIEPYLEQHYPEHFADIRVTYAPQLAVLDEKIAALHPADG
jgi:hypothetical protein